MNPATLNESDQTANLQQGFRKTEKRTLILSLYNIWMTFIASIAVCVAAAGCFRKVVFEDLRPLSVDFEVESTHYFVTYSMWAGIIVMALLCFGAFVFTTLLLNGSYQKTTKVKKVFYAYGVLVSALTVISAYYYTTLTKSTDLISVIIVFLFCMSYCVLLSLVRITFDTYQRTANYRYQNELIVVSIDKVENI